LGTEVDRVGTDPDHDGQDQHHRHDVDPERGGCPVPTACTIAFDKTGTPPSTDGTVPHPGMRARRVDVLSATPRERFTRVFER
jgi:hypothetical protein